LVHAAELCTAGAQNQLLLLLLRTRRPRSSRRINPRMLLREHNQWSLVGGGVIELRFNDV